MFLHDLHSHRKEIGMEHFIRIPNAKMFGRLPPVPYTTNYSPTVQDPFFLDRAVICSEQDWDLDCFEIHEFGSKDSYVFKVRSRVIAGV